MDLELSGSRARFLIRDRDGKFPGLFDGQLRTGGRTLQMRSPRVYHDEARSGIRPAERQVLKLLGTADFLSLETMP